MTAMKHLFKSMFDIFHITGNTLPSPLWHLVVFAVVDVAQSAESLRS